MTTPEPPEEAVIPPQFCVHGYALYGEECPKCGVTREVAPVEPQEQPGG